MSKDRPTTAERRNKSWSDPATAHEDATAVPGLKDQVKELRDELWALEDEYKGDGDGDM